MSDAGLDTSSESYGTAPIIDLDRFDIESERQKPRERGAGYSAFAAAATGAAMMMAVTAGGPALATATQDWSASEGVAVVSAPVNRRAILYSRLNAFRHLPENWDGVGGHAPTREAVDEGLAFLDLLPLGTPLPTPFPAGDGEVGFHWKTADSFAEVSFYGDGNIYFYAKLGRAGIEVDGAEPYTGRSIPKRLAQALAEI
jgi:hypothetical protein